LDNKVFGIIDARCNPEVIALQISYTSLC